MHQWRNINEDFWNSEYEENNVPWINIIPRVMPWFGVLLKYKLASRILDIGCGCGRNSHYLGKMGFSVIGVDCNSVGLQKAKEYSKLNNLSSVDFVRGSATNVPFKHNYFDGVLCLFTLNLLAQQEREQAILEMQRVLKHRGKLCLAEYVNEDLSEEKLMDLLTDFNIIGLWHEAIPLLTRSSPQLHTVCIIADNKKSRIRKL